MVRLLFSAGKCISEIKYDISLFCQVWYSELSKCVFIKNYPHTALFFEQKSIRRKPFSDSFHLGWVHPERLHLISCLIAYFPILFLTLPWKGFSFFLISSTKERKKKKSKAKQTTWNWGDLLTMQSTQN